MNKFVTFEGCDGVGKTAQLKKLKIYCDAFKPDVVFTREPGGSAVAEKIRGVILDAGNAGMTDMCEAFLYAAARATLERYCAARAQSGKNRFLRQVCGFFSGLSGGGARFGHRSRVAS